MLPQLIFAKWIFENIGLGLFLYNNHVQHKCMPSLSLPYICPSEIYLILFSYKVQIGPTLIYSLKKYCSFEEAGNQCEEWLYNKCIMQIPVNILCTLDKESN